MSLLEQLGSPALVRALGWTLLHSVWQGAAVALATAALLMLLHRHAAALRYRVAAASLLLLLLLSGGTFGRYYHAFRTHPTATAEAAMPSAAVGEGVAAAPLVVEGAALADATLAAEATPEPTSRLQQLLAIGRDYMERNLPLLVLGWVLGMLAMTLRFLGGLAYVQRLRRYRVADLPAEWQQRFDILAARAGLRRPVRILASGLVPGPLVVGYLRPMVLLPMSAATGLSAPELEAILAHELAHVMRRDYLFNILQSVAEILFFYHPAVWFLSNCLRTERENCCDDTATQLCGDSLVLAQALASLATLQVAPKPAAVQPRLAVAAAGPEGSLLSRVRRLVQHRAAAPTFSDGFWAACVVLVSVGVLVSSTVISLSAAPILTSVAKDAVRAQNSWMAAEASLGEHDATLAPAAPYASAAYEPATEVKTSDDTVVVYSKLNPKLNTKSGKTRLNEIKGLTVVTKDENGNIENVYVDGKKVSEAELPAYREALARQENRPDNAQSSQQRRQQRMNVLSKRISQQALAGTEPTEAESRRLSALTRELSALALEQANEALRQMPPHQSYLSREEAEEVQREVEESQRDAEETRRDALEDAAEARRDAEEARREALRDAAEARREALREAAEARREAAEARREEHENVWREALVEMMLRDGLIKSHNNYSFSLSANTLTVNGKKQPEAVQSKYRSTYEKLSGHKLSSTGSISMQRNGTSFSSNSNSSSNVPRPPRPPRAPLAPTAPAAPAAPAAPSAPTTMVQVSSDQIRAELRKDGLLGKNEKSFQFQLNDDGLTVNGEPQSAKLAEKYRKLLDVPATKKGSKEARTIQISVSE